MTQVGWKIYLTGGLKNQTKVARLTLRPEDQRSNKLTVTDSNVMKSMNFSRIGHSVCHGRNSLIVSGSWKDEAL